MPPKIKITKEAIIAAGINIIKEKGIEYLNAREIGKALSCSTQPIFRQFENMNELKKEIYNEVEKQYDDFIIEEMKISNVPFLAMGMSYISFAKNESNLFRLLFMSNSINVTNIFNLVEDSKNASIINLIAKTANISYVNAKKLYINIWFVTHGIASMVATNTITLEEDEIKTILQDTFKGLTLQFKKETN